MGDQFSGVFFYIYNFLFSFDLYLLLNIHFLNEVQNKYYYEKCLEDELCIN